MRADRLRGEFIVDRLDGDCSPDSRFFVLDYARDPAARAALEVYADRVEADDPVLASDLRVVLDHRRQRADELAARGPVMSGPASTTLS